MAQWKRDKPDVRLDFKGMDLLHPVDRIPNGRVPFAQNVRAYIKGGITGRNWLAGALFTLPDPVHSLRRMNDTTPNGPAAGYCYVIGAGTSLYVWIPGFGTKLVATGLSGNPVSMVPFRPNASVQPWMYVADSAQANAVTLLTTYLLTGQTVNFPSNGMLKVRSDGLCYKMGVQEPALAPTVTTQSTGVTTTGTLQATAIPWTNYQGQNPNYDFGELNGPPNPGTPNPVDGTAPFIVECANATTIVVSAVGGTATINGTPGTGPTANGPTPGSTNPGGYAQTAGSPTPPSSVSVIVGAFTDGAGNVIPAGVAPLYVPSVVDVGGNIGVQIAVPFGAQAFQIGINSTGDTFSNNSGSFTIQLTVTTDALPPNLGSLGPFSLFYWDDSPPSGPVGTYIWKNPGDPGGGTPRSTSNAVGNTTGNSTIFDATITGGLPGLPGIGSPSVPMQWSALSPESAVVGSAPVFASPLTVTNPSNTNFNNFNFVLYGKLYFPAVGQYTLVLTSHDDVIWGLQDLGGAITLISATASGVGEGGSLGLSNVGQTITVAQGYPLLPRQNYTSGNGGNYAKTTVVVNVRLPGVYGIEADYDYWNHSGRILLIEGSPTPGAPAKIIPPLTQAVRQSVSYAGVYRSSITGAQSNPSPITTPQTTPVLSNTVSLPWSPDPQIDKVDYYRQDSGLPNYTYVATGPNTNPPTAITDALTDLEAANNQQLVYTNYEPVPSIDLPRSGVVSVSGGVVSWVSGDHFNVRWLPGTIMLIGAPTQLPYVFISRPTSTTQVLIPGVPDGTNLVYNIAEPVLANQPCAYMFGPTDNVNYAHIVGDPLRPGTDYSSAASNLDAWPQTNQFDMTDPSEALVNGAMTNGLAFIGSIRRCFILEPNFFNALATVTGTSGSLWTQQATIIPRGLYMPRCVTVEGGGGVFFRVDDGIMYSRGGAAAISITDDDLYPLFPHENSQLPTTVEIAGNFVYPPDDTQPEKQQFSNQNGYMYYDYVGTDGLPHTLVFDIAAKGWVWDNYNPAVTIHAANEGESVGSTLAGCFDGSVRLFTDAGTEPSVAIFLTPAVDFGDTRADKHIGDLYVEFESFPILTPHVPGGAGR